MFRAVIFLLPWGQRIYHKQWIHGKLTKWHWTNWCPASEDPWVRTDESGSKECEIVMSYNTYIVYLILQYFICIQTNFLSMNVIISSCCFRPSVSGIASNDAWKWVPGRFPASSLAMPLPLMLDVYKTSKNQNTNCQNWIQDSYIFGEYEGMCSFILILPLTKYSS